MKKILLLLSVILIAKLMNAQTWDGSASTDWNTAANWSTNTVPISTSSIIIPGGVPNNPALPSNITLAGLTMNTAGVLNFNGFALTTGNLNLNNATLNNSSGVTDIVINCSGSTLQYASTTVNDNLTVNVSGTGIFYEGFPAANVHNGNTNFVLNGAGEFQSSYSGASTFNGNLTVTRTVAGTTTLFVNGHNGITGNFTYNNNAGGITSINSSGVSPAAVAPSITGTVNITVANGGPFTMRRIINNTAGGTINVVTTYALVTHDTLMVTDATFSGMATGNIDDFDRLQITGNLTVSDLAANSNSFYYRGSVVNGNTSFTVNSGVILYEAYQRSNVYNGNATFVRNGGGIEINYDTDTRFNGNLTLNSVSGISFGTSNKSIFSGTTAATIEQQGTQTITIPRIEIAKTGSGSLTLNDPVLISNNVLFTSGNIVSSGTNFLSFLAGSTHTGASTTSKVTGVVRKTGNTAFTFPVGTANSLNTVAMTAPAVATDVFSAEYIKKNPHLDGYDTSNHAPTMQRISGCEYWMANRILGTSNVTLTFSYQPPCSGTPGYISNPAFARIARWTGSTWENLGSGGSTGGTTGTVTTAGPVTNFSPFTFGSVDISINPLPLSLISFIATKQNTKALLRWQTSNEINVSHFEVEHSGDGNIFRKIAEVTATNAAGIQNYEVADGGAQQGANYYRLKMVDVDGKSKYSHIVKVDFAKFMTVSLWPNPARDEVVIQSDKKITNIEVIDMSGRSVLQMRPSANNRYRLSMLQSGNYYIRVSSDSHAEVIKILLQ